MIKSHALYLLIALSCCQFMAPQAFALQCGQILDSSTASIDSRIDQRQQTLQIKRKALEAEVHRSVGQLSSTLQNYLLILFQSERENIHPDFLNRLKISMRQDPIAKELSPKAKNKMIHLIKTRTMRPYMAFLLARYIDAVESPEGTALSEHVLDKIDRIVESYTLERALLKAKKRLVEFPHKENFKSVEDYLNQKNLYRINAINYHTQQTRLILSSMFEGLIQEVENEIAAKPIF